MELSLTAWSLPACTLREAADIARALGIGALDLGLFYRSALDRALILADPDAAADGVRAFGMRVPNYYHLFGEGVADRNLAHSASRAQNLRDLERVLRFADAAAIATVFVLPGIVNPGQSRREAADVSIAALAEMMALSQDFATVLCFEPHMQSLCESPALAREIVERTGVRLALDYAHFVCLGYRQDDIDPLAPLAAHVHLRQAKPGALQAKFAQGTLNFSAMFGTLRDAGYAGALSIEPVHQDYMNTLFDDVLTEIVLLRDCYTDWSGGI